MNLLIKIHKIHGTCPVFEPDDFFTLVDGYKLVSEKPVCMHALAALLPFYNALRISNASDWGLNKNQEDKAYIQCPDAVECTGGGTVVFEISKDKNTML